MRVPTTEVFNKFLLDNSQYYPFNYLYPTRSSFFCRWVMLRGRSPIGLTYYFPVFANSIPNRQLLEMISTGDAKPFPPQLSHVMDNMFWWGKTRSHHWYEQVIDSMGFLLENHNGNIEVQQREVVRYLIAFEVKAMILEHFNMMTAAYEVTFDQWFVNFNEAYKKGDFDGNKYTFRQMAEYSFDYVEWLIDEAEVNLKSLLKLALREEEETPS
jgi:hypothetical protein